MFTSMIDQRMQQVIKYLGNCFKGRFLEFRMYHKFADLYYKLSESTFNKKMSKF